MFDLKINVSLILTYCYLFIFCNKLEQIVNCYCTGLRALKVSYSDEGEGGVVVNCEKKHNFSEHSVVEQVVRGKGRNDNKKKDWR